MVTSAFAWYTDVHHSVKPVQSGYRFALSYNLIHPSDSLVTRPIIPEANDADDNLRHILLSWKHDKSGKAPNKLVYQLQHQYSQISLRATGMKGPDAYLLSHLRPVAEELHFRLYLTNLEMVRRGPAEFHDDYGDHGGMTDIIEEDMEVKYMVDLDGVPVRIAGFDVEDEEIIPGPLSENDPDDTEYEGYQGNVSLNVIQVVKIY